MYGTILQVPVLEMPWEDFILLLITALAGGAFGAALGALPAFIFTGFVVFLGEGLNILAGTLGGNVEAVPGDLGAGITGVIGFGVITGPHIAFAGGVAASAYAGKKYPEMEPDGWDYHFGKNRIRVRDETGHPCGRCHLDGCRCRSGDCWSSSERRVSLPVPALTGFVFALLTSKLDGTNAAWDSHNRGSFHYWVEDNGTEHTGQI